MIEIWKDVKGYEGLYQVSNLGNVKSLNRIKHYVNGRKYTLNGRVLKGILVGNGYYNIVLCSSVKRKFYIHRLVAQSFIPNPKNKPEVNHINGIKTDNRVVNLEWSTRLENQRHAKEMGLGNFCGEMSPTSKLKNEQVLEIRNSKLKGTELSKLYNIGEMQISRIKNNKNWKHL